MTIFNFLSLIGGLALFLFGMNVMGSGLEKMGGGKFESVLEKMTNNRIKGVLLGAGVTAVIQSSSAVTVMAVGFVNSGIMALNQVVGIIMGANIGTCITSWLLSLTGIESSNVFLTMLKPSTFSPILALIGIVLYMFCKSEKKKELGSILLGFSTLMFGMEAMSGNREFRMLIRNMKTAEENDFELPDNLQAQLREYQKTGFWWLKTLCQNGFGGILADDMGLGKTLQTIAFLLSEMQEAPENANRRSLIVAPASLVYNWESECARFAPELQTRLVAGTQEQRKEMIQNAGMQDILITSYDLLRRDIELYQDLPFFCEIIDEAQFIKNHATQGAKAVKTIHASFRLALTGTPVENQLSELWSIFDYLMPGFLYGYQKFREQFELPIVRNGDEERLERLQKMIRPFILRRLKKEVLKDLPDKIEKNMAACMEQKQKELYHAHAQRLALMLQNQTEEEFADSRFQVLSELTRLRQLCCDPALVY